MDRFSIRITGESGQGINSVGEILLKALKNSDYYVFGYREYPSLIEGGDASYQISISNTDINCASAKVDLQISLSRFSIDNYIRSIKKGGILIHSIDRLILNKEQKLYIESNDIKIIYVNAQEEVLLAGGSKLAVNVYLMGVLWKLLGLQIDSLEKEVIRRFGKKKEYLESNKAILQLGYKYELDIGRYELERSKDDLASKPLLSGNEALSLGAIKCGVRALYAYPMTPASSILTNLSKLSVETGMIVKQVDDEITAAQMSLGSMYAGTRSFTATSGGGFDLMTESVSMSGMTEIPLVVLLAQRPGPATGLPTWSSASDLQLAVYSGHGEFSRIVLAISDVESAFSLIQESFNLAELYQVPVIVLTEKNIAESVYLLTEDLPKVDIRRGLMNNPTDDTHRYEFTSSGISPRWLPGENKNTYVTNSDEHDMDGNSIEDSEVSKAMYDKRLRKLDTIKEEIPEPILYGDNDFDLLIVGWGSVKSVIMDIIDNNLIPEQKIAYLHYEYIYPLRTELLEKYAYEGKSLLLVENNATMQLGKLISQECGVKFNREFGKYDGRPIYPTEIINFIHKSKVNVM